MKVLSLHGFCDETQTLIELTRLYEHVRAGNNHELPALTQHPLIKSRKKSGEFFGDPEEELQISVQAHRVQCWWNSWSTKKSTYLRRRHVFTIFGDIVLKLTLLQPSSAASERVFSILVRLYGKQQVNLLEDYKEIGVMLNYNNRTN